MSSTQDFIPDPSPPPPPPNAVSPYQLDVSIDNLLSRSGIFEFEPELDSSAPVGTDTINEMAQEPDSSPTRITLITAATQEPNALFLIETRAQFIDLDRYISSDYFLNQLEDYSPEETIRRLGDAYVETRIILDQFHTLTGERFLNESIEANALITSLYDNAINAQTMLQLSIGVALSPEQIKELTQDIVWLEERIVKGETVLVPRLYLSSSASTSLNFASATIKAGNNLNITLTGDLTNSGLLSSDGSSYYQVEGDISNVNARIISENDLSILGANINNTLGTISANTGSLNLIAGRIKQPETTSPDGEGEVTPTPQPIILPTGTITNISGIISAGKDAKLVAHVIINKRTNIDFETITTIEKIIDNPDIKRSSFATVETIREQITSDSGAAAIIQAGGNLDITTSLLSNHFSTIDAKGNIVITAQQVFNIGQDLVTTSHTTKTYWEKQRYCSSALFGKCLNHSTRWVQRNNQSISSEIHDTTSATSTISAGGTLTILPPSQETGDTPQETDDTPQETGDTPQETDDIPPEAGDAPQETDDTLLKFTLLNTGDITSGGALTIDIKNVENRGGRITSEADISIDASNRFNNISGIISGNNVAINAGTVTNETIAQHYSFENASSDIIHQEALISANQNLTIDATDTITSIAGVFSAGENLSLNAANSISLQALATQYYFTDTYQGGSYEELSTTHRLTSLSAGGNLLIDSQGDITISGADISSQGDNDIIATNDITITSVQDKLSSSTTLDFEENAWLLGNTYSFFEQSSTQTTRQTTFNAGGSLNITSRKRNLSITAAKLISKEDINLSATEGKVSLLTNKDDIVYSRQLLERDLLWTESSGTGINTQNIQHVQIEEGGNLNINSQNIVVEYERRGNLQESLNNIAQTPGLEWMQELRDNPNVKWEEIEKQVSGYNYKHKNLSPEGATIVAIIIAVVSAGSASTISASVIGGAASAAATAAAITKVVTTLINNEGKIGDTLDELGSEEGLRDLAISLAISAASAGALDGADINGADINGVVSGIQSPFLQAFARRSLEGLISIPINAGIRAALSRDSFSDFDNNFEDYSREAIKSLPIDALAAGIAAEIGAAAISRDAQLASHFFTGCLIGELKTEGGCGSGATGALIGEAIALSYTDPIKEEVNSLLAKISAETDGTIIQGYLNEIKALRMDTDNRRAEIISIAGLTSFLVVGASGGDAYLAAAAARNAAENNAWWSAGWFIETALGIARAALAAARLVVANIAIDNATELVGNLAASKVPSGKIVDEIEDTDDAIDALKGIGDIKAANNALRNPAGAIAGVIKEEVIKGLINVLTEGGDAQIIAQYIVDNIRTPDPLSSSKLLLETYHAALLARQGNEASVP